MVKSHDSNFAQETRAGLGALCLCDEAGCPTLSLQCRGSLGDLPLLGFGAGTLPGFVPVGEEEPKREELTLSYASLAQVCLSIYVVCNIEDL